MKCLSRRKNFATCSFLQESLPISIIKREHTFFDYWSSKMKLWNWQQKWHFQMRSRVWSAFKIMWRIRNIILKYTISISVSFLWQHFSVLWWYCNFTREVLNRCAIWARNVNEQIKLKFGEAIFNIFVSYRHLWHRFFAKQGMFCRQDTIQVQLIRIPGFFMDCFPDGTYFTTSANQRWLILA